MTDTVLNFGQPLKGVSRIDSSSDGEKSQNVANSVKMAGLLEVV